MLELENFHLNRKMTLIVQMKNMLIEWFNKNILHFYSIV